MNPSKQSTPSKGENERVSLPVTPQATGDESAKSASSSSVIESSVVSLNVSLPSVLLLTAVVHLMDRNGRPVRCRMFLDCGAQANLITTAMYERLGLEGFPVAVNIVGVSNSRTKSSCAVTVNLESLYNDFHASLLGDSEDYECFSHQTCGSLSVEHSVWTSVGGSPIPHTCRGRFANRRRSILQSTSDWTFRSWRRTPGTP